MSKTKLGFFIVWLWTSGRPFPIKTIQIQSIVDPYFFLREYYGSFNGYFTLLPPINFLSQVGIDKVHAGPSFFQENFGGNIDSKVTDMGSKMPNIAQVVQNGRFYQHTIIEVLVDVSSKLEQFVVAEKASVES